MIRLLVIIAGAGVLAALPALGDNYLMRLGTMFAMYATLALSWNIIGGYAGYPSFSTAAFFGLGAYTGAILQGNGVPMYLAWAVACMMAGAFAVLLGAAILHLKGHYFAIASLVVAEVLLEIATSWTSLTGGGMGLTLPVVVLDDRWLGLIRVKQQRRQFAIYGTALQEEQYRDPPAHYFGVPAVGVRDGDALREALKTALSAAGPTVIEAVVNSDHYSETVFD